MGRCLLVFSQTLFWLIFSLSSASIAEADTERALRIKAAIIYNIAKFVEWPETLPVSEGVNVCLDGPSPLNPYITELLDNKAIAGRRFAVHLLTNSREKHESRCNVVFAPLERSADRTANAAASQSDPVLSVCEMQTLSWGACVIQLFEVDNKAKLAVDLPWASKIGLRISSELLDLAVVKNSPLNN